MNGKIEKISYDVFNSYDNSVYKLYELTDAQVNVLLVQSKYVAWSTRWHNVPQNFDIDNVRGEIQAQLMLPIEANMITCEDIDNCLDESVIIASLQSAIAANASDITLNTSAIATSAGYIALNTQVIQANKDDIALNTIAIQTNKDDIADHDARITTLENAPSGGSGSGDFDTITAMVKEEIFNLDWKTVQAEINVPIPAGYESLEFQVKARSTHNQNDRLRVWCNEDTTNTNYVWYRGTRTLNYAIIADIGSVSSSLSDAIIRLNHVQSGERPIFQSDYISTDSAGGRNVFGVEWENADEITTLKFDAQFGNLDAGGYIKVYGYKEREIAVPSEPETWTMELDFTVSNHADMFEYTIGTYSGAWQSISHNGVIGLELKLEADDFHDVLSFEVEYDLIQNAGSGNAEIDISTNAQFTPLFGTGQLTTLVYQYNVRNSVLSFIADLDSGASDSTFSIKKIRVNGTGDIPANFIPHII